MAATKRGARNPKVVSFSVRLDEAINARLERLADAAGSNKCTMAAMTIAAGLNMLEQVYIKQTEVIDRAVDQRAGELQRQTAQDVQRAAEVQEEAGKRPFQMEQLEHPRSEWSGYMAGL